MLINMNSLTAIVPFYNEESFIEKSVNKLLNIKKIEKIILVDDDSTDRSTEIAKNISKIHKNIIYKRFSCKFWKRKCNQPC